MMITGKKFHITAITILIIHLLLTGCGNKVDPEDISLEIPGKGSEQEYLGEFHPDHYGFIIYDVQENNVIKAHNSKKSFIPASVTKLFTAVYALENSDENEKYITGVSYTGKIKNGEITEDLYLKGSGDPALSISDLTEIAKKLKQEGIVKIKGNFFYDESLFPSKEVIDSSMSPEAAYNTGLSALTLNSNHVYSVQIKDNDGKVSGYDFIPSTPLNRALSYSGSPSYPLVKYKNISGRETWYFPEKRIVPRQHLPVKNPALFTAWTFKNICRIYGITLPAPKPGVTPSGSKELVQSESRNLSSIVKDILHNSNNTAAELLAITSAIKSSSQYNGTMGLIEEFYRTEFRQIDWSDFSLHNGSGLTSSGRVTPEQAAALLIYADKNNLHSRESDYYLPMSGLEGTLAGRLDMPETAMRVYAKTGTIFYASALCGLFYGNSGKKYIFSIFISDIDKRSAYEKESGNNISGIYEAARWSDRAENTIDRFISDNIKAL